MYKIHSYESILANLRRLTEELGHEPTTPEIDACPYLPSSRHLQRMYGGLKRIRPEAGLTERDHTTGNARRKTAISALQRANLYEAEIWKKMYKKHKSSTRDVVRDYAYQQYQEGENWYKNISCDIALVDPTHVTMIDLFYPKDMHSYGGCVRAKVAKLKRQPVSLMSPTTHEVIFVCVNPDITPTHPNVLSYSEFAKRFLS